MTTKRDLVRLAFEELGVSAYAGGLAAALYVGGSDSPTTRDILRLAYQELGIAPYNDGIAPDDFVETLPSPSKQQIVQQAFQQLALSAYAGGAPASTYSAGGDSPTLQEIVRLAYQEIGVPPYNGGVPFDQYTETLPSPTKQELIRLAYEQLGVPAYDGGVPAHTYTTGPTMQSLIDMAYAEFGTSVLLNEAPTPEQYAFARVELTSLLAEWQEAKGLELGYNPAASLNAWSGISDAAARPVATALAIRLSAHIGRTVSDDTRATAKSGLDSLIAWYNTSPVDRLDALMAEWNANGINLGYSQTAAITAASGIPAAAEQAVVTSLAMRLPTGSPVPDGLAAAAKAELDALRIYYNADPKSHLSAMMAEWKDSYEIDLSYSPTTGLGIPRGTLQVVSIALAMRLAAFVERDVSEASKLFYVNAFENLRVFYASSPYDRLSAMMEEWRAAYGLDLGYDATAARTAPSGIPASAQQMVVSSLALRLPAGKGLPDAVTEAAKSELDALRVYYAQPEKQLAAMLNEWRDNYAIDLDNPIPAGTLQVVGIGLAMRLAPFAGREVTADSKGLYGAAFGNLRAFYASSPYKRLDAMLQEWWASYKIDLGYNFTSPPTASDVANVPPGAEQVIATSLALRLAPALGRQVAPETRKTQADGLSSLRVAYMRIPSMQLARNTVAGAGNRYRRPFFNPARDPAYVVENGFPTYEDGQGVMD